MTQKCYVCGRTVDEFNQYFTERVKEKLADVEDIDSRADDLRSYIDYCKKKGYPTKLSDEECMILNMDKFSEYNSNISELNDWIRKIETSPLSILSYPVNFQKDVNTFLPLMKKIDSGFLKKYGSWTRDKYNSAINSDYPFSSPGEKKLISDCLDAGESPDYVMDFPKRCIEKIQDDIDYYLAELRESGHVNPEPFKSFCYEYGKFEVCVCPICHLLYFDRKKLRFC